MTTQTEAERLADLLDENWEHHSDLDTQAAAELRRLVSFNQQLMDEVARLQKREWVGLTEQEFEDIELGCRSTPFGKIEAMQKVEAKLKGKNT